MIFASSSYESKDNPFCKRNYIQSLKSEERKRAIITEDLISAASSELKMATSSIDK